MTKKHKEILVMLLCALKHLFLLRTPVLPSRDFEFPQKARSNINTLLFQQVTMSIDGFVW